MSVDRVDSNDIGELLPPPRMLLTPGPAMLDPRVYRAMSAPLVGHMDPWFTAMIGDVQTMLRRVFQTENRITFPVSASGSGGIEAAVVNPLEPGDEAIVCVNGSFSERMAIIAERTGAKIIRVEAPLGRTVDPEDVRRAAKGRNVKLVGMVHGETSTSALTKIEPFRKVADEIGALLLVDTVASLVGHPVDVDGMRIDICFSGTQKAISAPPGMSPITVNTRVEEVIRARKTKPVSWYFDLTHTMTYWGKDRTYHHTPAIPLIYGLREALRIVLEEGLEASYERHRQNQQALIAGLEAMGLEMFVPDPAERMTTVTGIHVPKGVDDHHVRAQLRDEFNIEIAGGINTLKGKLWRVGLMGFSSQKGHVLQFLSALEKTLLDQGFQVPSGAGAGAAVHYYTQGVPVAVSHRK
jgi:alanine-glyoxylate transaminase/serine-glyoxylate transaminase/serine-pyruvate transaminase